MQQCFRSWISTMKMTSIGAWSIAKLKLTSSVFFSYLQFNHFLTHVCFSSSFHHIFKSRWKKTIFNFSCLQMSFFSFTRDTNFYQLQQPWASSLDSIITALDFGHQSPSFTLFSAERLLFIATFWRGLQAGWPFASHARNSCNRADKSG